MTHKLPSDYLAQGWCQEAEACDASGHAVVAEAFTARSWCLHGSRSSARFNRSITSGESAYLGAWLYSHGYTPSWNDDPFRTQEEAVAVMREAEAAVLGLSTGRADG